MLRGFAPRQPWPAPWGAQRRPSAGRGRTMGSAAADRAAACAATARRVERAPAPIEPQVLDGGQQRTEVTVTHPAPGTEVAVAQVDAATDPVNAIEDGADRGYRRFGLPAAAVPGGYV